MRRLLALPLVLAAALPSRAAANPCFDLPRGLDTDRRGEPSSPSDGCQCADLAPGVGLVGPCDVVANSVDDLTVAWRAGAGGGDEGGAELEVVKEIEAATRAVVGRYRPLGLNRPIVVLARSDPATPPGSTGPLGTPQGAGQPCAFWISIPNAAANPGEALRRIIAPQVARCAYADWLALGDLTRAPGSALAQGLGGEGVHRWWVDAWDMASSDRLFPRTALEAAMGRLEPYDLRRPPTAQQGRGAFAFLRYLLAEAEGEPVPELRFLPYAEALLRAPADTAGQWRAFVEVPGVLDTLDAFGRAAYHRQVVDGAGRPLPMNQLASRDWIVHPSPTPTSYTEFFQNGVTERVRFMVPAGTRLHLKVASRARHQQVLTTLSSLEGLQVKLVADREYVVEAPCDAPGYAELFVTGLNPDPGRSILLEVQLKTEEIGAMCSAEPQEGIDDCLVGEWVLDRWTFIDYWSSLSYTNADFGLRSIAGDLRLLVTPEREMSWRFDALSQRVDIYLSPTADPVETTVQLDGMVRYRARTVDDAQGHMTKLVLDPLADSPGIAVRSTTRLGGMEVEAPAGSLPPIGAPTGPTHLQAHCTDQTLAFVYRVPASGQMQASQVYYRFTRRR